MIVPMMPGLNHLDPVAHRGSYPLLGSVPQFQKPVHRGLRFYRQPVTTAPQELERAIQLLHDTLLPTLDLFFGGPFGTESRVVGGRGERLVQLAGTESQGVHEAHEEGIVLLIFRLRPVLFEAPGGHEPFLQIAGKVVQGEGPSVALVADEALQKGQGGWLALGVLVLDGPGEWRRIPEIGLIGKITSDLQVRVDPRLELAVRLHDEPLPEYYRGVRLLDAGPAHAQGFIADQLVESPGAREADDSVPGVNLAPLAHRRYQAAAEILVGQRVVEHTDPGPPPEPGHRVGHERGDAVLFAFPPGRREWQKVGLRFTFFAVVHPQQSEQPVRADLHLGDDFDAFDLPAFTRKPASHAEVVRKRLFL